MEGAKKKIDKAIVKVITEQINIASKSRRCLASVPISSAPIGSNPKNVKVYTPITLPRMHPVLGFAQVSWQYSLQVSKRCLMRK